MANVRFDEVVPSNEQVIELYNLLARRKHGISHHSSPSLEQHISFVESHPYRFWFLIYIDKEAIGSFYISNENTIGVNIVHNESLQLLSDILEFVKQRYSPLPAVKSVRGDVFAINVPPDNDFLIKSLRELGAKLIQITYAID